MPTEQLCILVWVALQWIAAMPAFAGTTGTTGTRSLEEITPLSILIEDMLTETLGILNISRPTRCVPLPSGYTATGNTVQLANQLGWVREEWNVPTGWEFGNAPCIVFTVVVSALTLCYVGWQIRGRMSAWIPI